jgi:uncharacterized protein YciW
MVWIRTIAPEHADGRLADAYGWQAARLGRPTEFTQLGSLDADVVHARLVLYKASENIPSALSPEQRWLISYLTSVLNVTPHCASLARTQIETLDGGEDLARILDRRDYGALPPAEMTEADVESLRAVGFGDLEILHANNQCAHLNYTNRVANGLGLLHEAVPAERTVSRVPG